MAKTKSSDAPARIHPLAALKADAASHALLKKRAAELARRAPGEATQVAVPFVHFRLGRSEEYGVPHLAVEEVVFVSQIARVPCAPPAVLGVINRRGQMLPVVDLKHVFGLFGLDSGAKAEERVHSNVDVIVISAAGFMVGFCVDELLGVSEYTSDALSAVPSAEGALERNHVLGLLHGHVAILNVEKLLVDLCA